MGGREYFTSSLNWTQIQTQTLREPGPFFENFRKNVPRLKEPKKNE